MFSRPIIYLGARKSQLTAITCAEQVRKEANQESTGFSGRGRIPRRELCSTNRGSSRRRANRKEHAAGGTALDAIPSYFIGMEQLDGKSQALGFSRAAWAYFQVHNITINPVSDFFTVDAPLTLHGSPTLCSFYCNRSSVASSGSLRSSLRIWRNRF